MDDVAQFFPDGPRFLGFAVGLFMTLIIGYISVAPILKLLRGRIHIPPISDDADTQAAWERLAAHPEPSGNWIGTTERVIFFAAIFVGRWEAIGVWLAFKVASKWEAWNHMSHVPDKLDDKVDVLRFAIARRRWAAQGYATFVVGTALNVFVATICVAVVSFLAAHCSMF